MTATKSRSPIKRLGGKFRLASYIVGLIPEHRIYVEPFVGSAAVFFHKGNLANEIPGYREVLNDLDDGIYIFLKMLRDKPEELATRLSMTPYSRRETALSGQTGGSELDRAARLAVAVHQTFGGKCDASWGFGRANSAHHPKRWRKIPAEILAAADRLRDVYLDSVDFEVCLKNWDTKETFFFVDPPYVGTEYWYTATFAEEDHARLAGLLQSIRGKVLVTYYDHPLVRRLYRGWRIEEKAVKVMFNNIPTSGKHPRRTELYIMNYDRAESSGQELLFN